MYTATDQQLKGSDCMFMYALSHVMKYLKQVGQNILTILQNAESNYQEPKYLNLILE